MPTTLRVIAILELLAGLVLTLWCWFGAPESFFLGLAFLLTGLISAAVFVALAQILENSELLRLDLVRLRHDLWGELNKLRDGGPAPNRPPSSPPPRPSTSPIRESTDPITGRVSYLYNGVTYDSRIAAVAQLAEDERRGAPPVSG
ncbi:hypothetical protein [Inquilinus sp. Marseille-Q2685]|uniref:hypothetical protein n=1 Tax=Inquilinus sp. Marseille-Q2685 TaxID=2866581 RepID=UPI001CE3E808|nr:hypothetical protein [Inquilinus sp. Marseille-Q2685]